MNNQVTNLELSKALSEFGIEGVSEKWWLVFPSETVCRVSTVLDEPDEFYPAYSLSELILLLPEIGIKLGWEGICTNCFVNNQAEDCIDCKNVVPKKQARKILDLYIQDKNMEGVSKYLLDLIKG